ncbi:hypothetical protein [Streptomyces sp. NPDC046261]|uniref:hypothetical protein n=1 Tax=Streptomyces sp. NPDC046261 TaxID=3157200 RepID=UPI0033FC93F4
MARTDGGQAPVRDQYSVFLAAVPDTPLSGADALPPVRPEVAYLVVTEDAGEEPLGRALADLLTGHGALSARTVPLPGDGNAWKGLLEERHLPEGGGCTTAVVLLLGDGQPAEARECVDLAARRIAVLGRLSAAHQRLPEGSEAELWLITRPCGAVPSPRTSPTPSTPPPGGPPAPSPTSVPA